MRRVSESDRMRAEVIRIVAARGNSRVLEYTVREFAEPGSIPNWFPGVLLLLKEEIQDDEKIVFHEGIIRIVKKTAMDRLVDWLRKKKNPEAALAEEDGCGKGLPH